MRDAAADTEAAGTPTTTPTTDHRTPRTEDRAGRDPRPPDARTDKDARPDHQAATDGARPDHQAATDGARPADRAATDGARPADRTATDRSRAADRMGTGPRRETQAAPAETPQAKDDPVVPGPRGQEPAGGTDDTRQFGRRMDHAVHDFVEDPRRAVREADAVLNEVIERVERAIEARRDSLRAVSATGADTEALRVALTRYRDLAGRLLTLSAGASDPR